MKKIQPCPGCGVTKLLEDGALCNRCKCKQAKFTPCPECGVNPARPCMSCTRKMVADRVKKNNAMARWREQNPWMNRACVKHSQLQRRIDRSPPWKPSDLAPVLERTPDCECCGAGIRWGSKTSRNSASPSLWSMDEGWPLDSVRLVCQDCYMVLKRDEDKIRRCLKFIVKQKSKAKEPARDTA